MTADAPKAERAGAAKALRALALEWRDDARHLERRKHVPAANDAIYRLLSEAVARIRDAAVEAERRAAEMEGM